MNFTDYLALDGVNHSRLKLMDESPKAYRYATDHPDHKVTDYFTLGHATHCATLEPDDFPLTFVVWDGGRRGTNAHKAFVEANADKEIISKAGYEKAMAIRDSVRGNPVAAPYLTGPGLFEHTLQWEDEATGILCKGRTDRVAHETPWGRVLVELKTAQTLDRRLFANAATGYGYHRALSFYKDGLEANGIKIDKVVMIVAESSPPHDSAVLVVDSEALQAGRHDYRKMLTRLADCRESGEWPGRYPDEGAFELPHWYWRDGEDDEETDVAGALGLTGLEE
jgi:hypothetical protein